MSQENNNEVVIEMESKKRRRDTKNKNDYLDTELGDDIFDESVSTKPFGVKRRKKEEDTNTSMNLEAENNWTLDISKRLQYFAYLSYSLRYMHGEDVKYYSGLQNHYLYAASVMQLFSAIIIAGLIGLVNFEGIYWVFFGISIFNILLIFTSSALTAYIAQWGVANKIAENGEKSNKYGKLCRKITNQMFLPPSERRDAATVLEDATERANELDSEAPTITAGSEAKWNTIKDNNPVDLVVPLPLEFRSKEEKNRSFAPRQKKGFNIII